MKPLKVISYSVMVIGVGALICCSNAKLYQPEGSPATAAINFCTTPSTNVVTKLKYLFVTDVSGSNQQNFTISGPSATPVPDPAGGTDPTGVRRYSGLLNFLQNSPASPDIYYAGLFFSTSQITPFSNFIGGGAAEGTPSLWYTGNAQNTATYMAAQYQNIWCYNSGTPQMPPNCTGPQDPGGWTDYVGTLTLIQNAMIQDIQHEQNLVALGQPLEASSYVIFWTSDGFPYTASGAQNQGTIVQEVQDIMNLKASQQYGQYIASITFNTAFYYTTSTGSYEYNQAASLMQEMASIGQGNYVQIQNGQDVNYSQFAIPTQNPPFVLRDFWIHDASAVWWNNNGKTQLMLDSDNDGIPDNVELQWGSNPNAYDSDHNGVGDGVEYYLWGSPCGSILPSNLGQSGQTCTVAGAKTGFRATTTGCGGPGVYPNVYPDTDQDYLNDCEEGLLNSNSTDFDSNQDWVPDQLEWLWNIPFLFGTNGLNATPANDGVDNYQKLKELYPINVPVSQITAAPLTYTITQTTSSATQSCYAVDVQNITTMSSSDVIRVYIMESEGAEGTSLRHMRVLKNVTHMNGKSLSLTDGDFTP